MQFIRLINGNWLKAQQVGIKNQEDLAQRGGGHLQYRRNGMEVMNKYNKKEWRRKQQRQSRNDIEIEEKREAGVGGPTHVKLVLSIWHVWPSEPWQLSHPWGMSMTLAVSCWCAPHWNMKLPLHLFYYIYIYTFPKIFLIGFKVQTKILYLSYGTLSIDCN